MSVKPPRADVGQSPLTNTQRTGSTGDAPAPAKSNTASTSSDTLTLTNSVAEMLKLEESLAQIPDVNDARVNAIKASIADGSYEISPEKIVDSLLKLEKDLT